jgi:acetyltransferase-like isoleucine patch superfamily enzyme
MVSPMIFARPSVARVLKSWSLLSSVRNRVLNGLATAACGTKITIDWRNIKIFHPAHIRIGNRFSAGHSLWLESVEGRGRIDIGNDVNFSDFVHIGSAVSIRIEDGVLIGSKVLITDHSHGGVADVLTDVCPNERAIVSKGPVVVCRSAWIGDGACILAGVTVGERAIVGANSVVSKDIPAGTVWAGAPARLIWPTPCLDEPGARKAAADEALQPTGQPMP